MADVMDAARLEKILREALGHWQLSDGGAFARIYLLLATEHPIDPTLLLFCRRLSLRSDKIVLSPLVANMQATLLDGRLSYECPVKALERTMADWVGPAGAQHIEDLMNAASIGDIACWRTGASVHGCICAIISTSRTESLMRLVSKHGGPVLEQRPLERVRSMSVENLAPTMAEVLRMWSKGLPASIRRAIAKRRCWVKHARVMASEPPADDAHETYVPVALHERVPAPPRSEPNATSAASAQSTSQLLGKISELEGQMQVLSTTMNAILARLDAIAPLNLGPPPREC